MRELLTHAVKPLLVLEPRGEGALAHWFAILAETRHLVLTAVNQAVDLPDRRDLVLLEVVDPQGLPCGEDVPAVGVATCESGELGIR